VVLLVPLMIVWFILILWLSPFPRFGQHAAPLQPDKIQAMMARMSLIWLFMMALSIFIHIQAIRWMLRPRWSDFRLAAVTNEADSA
jgi:hypothetical protein